MRLIIGVSALVAVALGVATAGALTAGNAAHVDGPARIHAGRFDVNRAWRLVHRQLAYGQRPAGSPQLRALADELVSLMPRGRFERVPGRGLRNIVGIIPGRRPGLLIGAHYDTLTTPRGFVGANNGAAGSAIVLELARDLRRLHRLAHAQQIAFVLFDGEEPARGRPEDVGDFYAQGLRGSKAYVEAHARDTSAMVLLDYVGNRGLQLPREGSSSRPLWRQLRAAARTVGASSTFPDRTETTILDDHTPFLRAGIPAIDLIDWSYDGHSLSDTADKLSRRSIEAVGETVLALVRRVDSQAAGARP